jgi:hypothetical protein
VLLIAGSCPVPWRALAGPCAVAFLGGVWFYALIVELSFVLTGLGITASGTIGAAAAAMSVATALGALAFAVRGPRARRVAALRVRVHLGRSRDRRDRGVAADDRGRRGDLVQAHLADRLTSMGDVRALDCPFAALPTTEARWWAAGGRHRRGTRPAMTRATGSRAAA